MCCYPICQTNHAAHCICASAYWSPGTCRVWWKMLYACRLSVCWNWFLTWVLALICWLTNPSFKTNRQNHSYDSVFTLVKLRIVIYITAVLMPYDCGLFNLCITSNINALSFAFEYTMFYLWFFYCDNNDEFFLN